MGRGLQFIGLHLTQLDGSLTDKVFLPLRGVVTGFGLPIRDRAFNHANSKDYRWDGAAATQQRQHDTDAGRPLYAAS